MKKLADIIRERIVFMKEHLAWMTQHTDEMKMEKGKTREELVSWSGKMAREAKDAHAIKEKFDAFIGLCKILNIDPENIYVKEEQS
jgi:hypothetical protein